MRLFWPIKSCHEFSKQIWFWHRCIEFLHINDDAGINVTKFSYCFYQSWWFDILGPQALLAQSNMTVPALNKMAWIPLQSISLSQWDTQVYLEGCWIVFWSIASSAPHPQACIQASDIWAKICTGDSSTPAIRFEQFKFASNSVHHWGRPEAAMACSEEKGKTMAMRTGLWILCSTPKTDVWPGGPHSKQNLVWRYVDCLIHSS